MQLFGQLVFRSRRTHREDKHTADSDRPDLHQLLLQVREQLSYLSDFRQQRRQQATATRKRLQKLSGMAQKAALNGLLQEGVSILVVQHELAQQLARIESELAQTEIVERRLRAAERQLIEHAEEHQVHPTNGDEMMPSDPKQEDHLLSAVHVPAHTEQQARALRRIFDPAPDGIHG